MKLKDCSTEGHKLKRCLHVYMTRAKEMPYLGHSTGVRAKYSNS